MVSRKFRSLSPGASAGNPGASGGLLVPPPEEPLPSGGSATPDGAGWSDDRGGASEMRGVGTSSCLSANPARDRFRLSPESLSGILGIPGCVRCPGDRGVPEGPGSTGKGSSADPSGGRCRLTWDMMDDAASTISIAISGKKVTATSTIASACS